MFHLVLFNNFSTKPISMYRDSQILNPQRPRLYCTA